ncbi:hypothetical protein DF037_13875 [Burkholderia contaminans]|uniref:Secreted protein n=1 Tax=Burkholderia contaminans TaxID=488447 RepID=A0A3N8R2N5_9BURK|nr:hypothetical protein DF037_13875 [Burkholderia contaminans]
MAGERGLRRRRSCRALPLPLPCPCLALALPCLALPCPCLALPCPRPTPWPWLQILSLLPPPATSPTGREYRPTIPTALRYHRNTRRATRAGRGRRP